MPTAKVIAIFLLGCLLGILATKYLVISPTGLMMPVASLPDGAKYEGDMVNGIIEGEGRMVWGNGNEYTGTFKNGLFHGKGHYTTPTGWSYQGDFFEGDMSGTGTIIYSKDQKYSGELKHGRANGFGELTSWGDTYAGEFVEDRYEGTGTLTSRTGDVYRGEFKAGSYHGQGEYVTTDGRTYSGEFVEGAFTGQGKYSDTSGMEYEGGFENWYFHGAGNLLDPAGDRYVGTFNNGRLEGAGEHIAQSGAHYQGNFQNGLYHGSGTLKTAEGDTYEGEFEYGQYHGAGTLTYAQPVDGASVVTGIWEHGKLTEAEGQPISNPAEVNNELALYNQHELLQAAWNTLEQNDPDSIDMYFLGIAGDGTQGVFRREALYVKNYFDETFNTRNKSIALINSRDTVQEHPLATTTSVNRTLQEITKRMDPDNDILFIYMTSHGSDDFQFTLKQEDLSLPDLPATTLAESLQSLPVKWKVIVISACYSGGFIPELENDHTLIITAASSESQSFGCDDKNDFTYFGEAYFKDALPESANFVEAFDKAIAIIKDHEDTGEYENSHPQIHKPEPILEHLARWQSGLSN